MNPPQAAVAGILRRELRTKNFDGRRQAGGGRWNLMPTPPVLWRLAGVAAAQFFLAPDAIIDAHGAGQSAFSSHPGIADSFGWPVTWRRRCRRSILHYPAGCRCLASLKTPCGMAKPGFTTHTSSVDEPLPLGEVAAAAEAATG
jgi:hypothetical protein